MVLTDIHCVPRQIAEILHHSAADLAVRPRIDTHPHIHCHGAIAGIASRPASASLAHADPASNNDQYDQFMISHGVAGDGPGAYSLEYLLAAGYDQCAALKAASTESVLIGLLEHQMGRAQSGDIVVAAHRYLCPDASRTCLSDRVCP